MARDLDTRFSSKVDRSGPHHLWLGSINQQRGTGQIKVDGRIVTAHRVAWELQRGPVPAGQRVRTCPAIANCVNVDHLSLAGGWSSSDPHDRLATSIGSSRRRRRGGGSIRERSPGVWELSVVAGSDECSSGYTPSSPSFLFSSPAEHCGRSIAFRRADRAPDRRFRDGRGRRCRARGVGWVRLDARRP